MAAATTIFETLDIGDHVVAPQQMYWSIRRWLQDLATRGRIELDLVPNGDQAALERALRPGRTRIVWVETPANPTCAITDIAATAADPVAPEDCPAGTGGSGGDGGSGAGAKEAPVATVVPVLTGDAEALAAHPAY